MPFHELACSQRLRLSRLLLCLQKKSAAALEGAKSATRDAKKNNAPREEARSAAERRQQSKARIQQKVDDMRAAG